jgi:hypothetical protein
MKVSGTVHSRHSEPCLTVSATKCSQSCYGGRGALCQLVHFLSADLSFNFKHINVHFIWFLSLSICYFDLILCCIYHHSIPSKMSKWGIWSENEDN